MADNGGITLETICIKCITGNNKSPTVNLVNPVNIDFLNAKSTTHTIKAILFCLSRKQHSPLTLIFLIFLISVGFFDAASYKANRVMCI